MTNMRSGTENHWLKVLSCICVIMLWICFISIDFIKTMHAEPSDVHKIKTLTLAGSEYLPADIAEAIRKNLPGYRIIEDHLRFPTPDDIPAAMITGASDVDLFLLTNTKDDIRSMIAKGYLYDLSDNAALSEFQSLLRGNVRRFVSSESGRMSVFPIYLGFGCWVSRPYLLDTLELEAPGDFISLCDFIDTWYSGYHDAYPDYEAVASTFMDRNGLYREALELYLGYLRGSGRRLSFDTDLFRKMIGRCQAVHMPEIEISEAVNSESALEADMPVPDLKTYALSGGYGYHPSLEHQRSNNIYTESPFLMSADAHLPAYPSGRLFVLAVNARSPRRAEAVKFLEELSSVMPSMALLQLTESVNGGIPNPAYDADIAFFQDELNRAVEQKNHADEIQSRMIDERISYLERSLSEAMDSLRYLVTADEAVSAGFKFNRVIIGDVSDYPENNRNIMALYDRFLAGNLTLDLFIRQADNTLRLMDAEKQ